MDDREKLRHFVAEAARSAGGRCTQLSLRAAVADARQTGALDIELSDTEIIDEIGRWFAGMCLAAVTEALERDDPEG